MPYIKRIVMNGFKSFAKPTTIELARGMNVFIGPNGAGKSNITDGLCFVLGRLSIKSMRAEKLSGLIYNGGKYEKPAKQAIVELYIDNSDGAFVLGNEKPKEIKISRIIRRDGQSQYKINDKTCTRQELLELLGQQGIDPYGFNIILQDEIFKFVTMRSEDRRKLIEDISGIGIYEARKQKALRELEKTEAKLKEVRTILNERYAYLKNLEAERKQALKFKQLEATLLKLRLSLLVKKQKEKQEAKQKAEAKLKAKAKEQDRIAKQIEQLKQKRASIVNSINSIDEKIKSEAGQGQEELRKSITELKAEQARLSVTIENRKQQLEQLKARKKQLQQDISNLQKQISELEAEQETALSSNVNAKLKKLKQQLEQLKARLKYYEKKQLSITQASQECNKAKALIEEKEKQLLSVANEIENINKNIVELEKNLTGIDTVNINNQLEKQQEELQKVRQRIKQIEQQIVELTTKQNMHKQDLDKIKASQQCPTCLRVIDDAAREEIHRKFSEIINNISTTIQQLTSRLQQLQKQEQAINEKITSLNVELEKAKEDMLIAKQINALEQNKQQLEEKKRELAKQIDELKKKYDDALKIMQDEQHVSQQIFSITEQIKTIEQEIARLSITNKPNVDLQLSMARKELSRIEFVIKKIEEDIPKTEQELSELQQEFSNITSELKQKQLQEQKLNEKFKKLLDEKTKLQNKLLEIDKKHSELQGAAYSLQSVINETKIELAKIDAEIHALRSEILTEIEEHPQQFALLVSKLDRQEQTKDSEKQQEIQLQLKEPEQVETQQKAKVMSDEQKLEIAAKIAVKRSIDDLKARLIAVEQQLREIGSVNLRALEVYDDVKQEYEKIEQKMQQLVKEKESILKMIQQIDRKKKRTFMKTFEQINSEFTRNFASLSSKGTAMLELENKEDPFAGGVDIVIKLAKGKYFDINSLSGGEKTLVALAFIFAIQKFRPYFFYIFDEIDAALDKHNSERLAELMRKHIKHNQCIIITHNDAIISQAEYLYGVTMRDGVSKVVSIKL